jgi:exosome complex component RRP42
MSNDEIIWEVKKSSIKSLIESGKRADERAFDEFRKIEVQPNFIPNAEGSCLVKMGNTQVLAGIKIELGKPYLDSPAEGVMITNAELVPIASPEFYSGPPNENTIELARVVDRGIRESKMIEFDKLCIEEGEKVWNVLIDIHVLDHDGNLIDAASLAAVNALWRTQIPKLEGEIVIRSEKTGKLPVRKKPVSCTFVKIGSKNVLDPSLDEEYSMDARLTLSTEESGALCAAQKAGTGSYVKSELDEMIDIAMRKGKELREYY